MGVISGVVDFFLESAEQAIPLHQDEILVL